MTLWQWLQFPLIMVGLILMVVGCPGFSSRTMWERLQGSLIVTGPLAMLVGLVVLLAGCPVPPPVRHHLAQQQTTLVSSRTADPTYHCAATLFARQPGVARLSSDATTHVMSGEWHRAVDMVIAVDPLPPGSRITIAGSVPPTRQVTGDFDEVNTLSALIQEQCL